MKERVQSRANSSDTRVAPPIVREILRMPGRPLDPGIRHVMEPRFGHDFGHVRVHAGEHAAASASAVDAHAYTTGPNIVFARGQYSPETSSGRQLLAHELAHTVQQRNSAKPSGPLSISEPRGSSEREADRAAEAVAANRPVSLTQRADAMVARQPAGPKAEEATGPTNHELVEQALTKFLKAVKRAYPKESLPKNKLVHTQVLRLAASSKNKPLLEKQLETFLSGMSAPTEPAPLAKAVVQLLPGPVDAREIEHLKNQSVFKPPEPGVIERYGKLAPAELPPRDVVEESDARKQAAAEATQRTSPTLTPQFDPYRVGQAVAGGKEKEKSEFVNPPVPRAEEPLRPPAVVNTDIKLPSTVSTLTVDKPIHFQVNLPDAVVADDKALHASLTTAGISDFDLVLRWLKRGPEYSVQLTGMASIEGKPKHNLKLGENRARSVANALLRNGISAFQIGDVPGKPETCTPLSLGIYNCGDTRASKTKDPNDRKVQARMFVTPKSSRP